MSWQIDAVQTIMAMAMYLCLRVNDTCVGIVSYVWFIDRMHIA